MTIVIFIIALSALILIHELGHFLAAKWFGLLVEEFGIGFPPRLFGKKIGETVYSVNLLPFGGFVRIHGESRDRHVIETQPEKSFWFLRAWKRAVILGAGVIMNFVLGWIVLAAIYMVGAPKGVIVTNVSPDSPAASAGLLQNDRILDFERTEDFINFVNGKKGEEIMVRVARGGETTEVNVVPRVNPPEGQGPLGVSLTEVGFSKLPFFQSLKEGLVSSFKILGGIVAALAGLIGGIFIGKPALESFVGPVGVFQAASQAADFGFAYFMQIIGLISLNLVVLNVLPIPALDGGRLFFLLIEKLKGSPIRPERERAANAIGFIALLLLMVAITIRDVIKLF